MLSANTVSPLVEAGRRFHARRRMDGLSYVEFGSDNGAILIDVGEGGLGFQSVMPVTRNQALVVKFKLPAKSTPIEGLAEVAWVNESGKGGGLRFVKLSADAGTQIRQWTGVLTAHEARGVPAGNGNAHPAQERATEPALAVSGQQSTISDTNQNGEAPAQFVEVPTPTETAQIAGASLEAHPAPSSDHSDSDDSDEAAASREVQVHQDAWPEVSAIPEFTVEASAAPDASLMPATAVEWGPPIAAAGSEVRESALLLSAHLESGVAKTNGAPQPTAAAAATPAKAARVPAWEEKNLAPAQKIPQKPPSRSESHLPLAQRQAAAAPGTAVHRSLGRQPQRPAPPTTQRENMVASQDEEWKPQLALASQALKIGIGAAAGACLVLVLVVLVPSLRTRVHATATAKAGGPILPAAAAFQIEVADLNNRRWILRSGEDAGSPFSEAPSRRDAPSVASSRSESKSSRAEENEDSGDKPSASPSKPRRPAQLALSRPRTNSAAAASAQPLAPSIFDGITPPIGSVSDNLAAGGPELPRIVTPDSPSGIRTSALQAAVLEKRVPPIYPPIARASRLTGDVLVNATIGTDGVPKNLKVISGDQRLVPAALDAIEQWRYRPATLGGQPIETQTVITVSFHLNLQ